MMSMSRVSILLPAAALVCVGSMAGSPVAHAQDGQQDRFFSDKVGEAEAEGEEPEGTLLQGSLTSSTFVYRESGGLAVNAGDGATENASPQSRLYTDLRAQIDAKHIAGSGFDVRLDARTRLSSSCELLSTANNPARAETYGDCRNQSGLYGDNEYDIRELYIHRTGESIDIRVGRQYMLDFAATKIDGLSLHYQSSERLSFVGFAGLYPSRGSRSITEDYPVQILDGVENGRIMPVAGGGGGVYRFSSAYGSVGGVAILPLADEEMNAAEPLRVFLTSNGYWRQSRKLDFYHFAVVDLQGSGGTGLTNLSVGVNFRPINILRINGAYNRVDTETLEVTAQNRLEDGNETAGNVVQNHIDVTRIASDAFRLGVSAALREQRFEISASGQLRQRPTITILTPGAQGQQTFRSARAAEILLSFVDRRSFGGFRLGASVLRIFGIGNQDTFARSESTMFRAYGAREFKEGLGQYEIDVSFLASDDTSDPAMCGNSLANPIDCFGASSVRTLSLGGTAFYRIGTDWMLVGSGSLARQGFTTQRAGVDTPEDANLLLSLFARIAYRF